jgi:hypothetical protein
MPTVSAGMPARAVLTFLEIRPKGNDSQKQKQGRLEPVVFFNGFNQGQAEKKNENRDARAGV